MQGKGSMAREQGEGKIPTIAEYVWSLTDKPQLLALYSSMSEQQIEEQFGHSYRAHLRDTFPQAWIELLHATNGGLS